LRVNVNRICIQYVLHTNEDEDDDDDSINTKMCRGSVWLQIHVDEKADFELRWDLFVVASGVRVRSKAGMVGVFLKKTDPTGG